MVVVLSVIMAVNCWLVVAVVVVVVVAENASTCSQNIRHARVVSLRACIYMCVCVCVCMCVAIPVWVCVRVCVL